MSETIHYQRTVIKQFRPIKNLKLSACVNNLQGSGWKHWCFEVLPTSSVVIDEDEVEHEEQFDDPVVEVKYPLAHFSHLFTSMFRYVPASHSTK